MSRIGKQPIDVPKGVKVSIADGLFAAEGPKGRVEQQLVDRIAVKIDGDVVHVERADDERRTRAFHGLMRSLVANAVNGVATGFTKELDIVGVGYRAEVAGRELQLALGYSHPVNYAIPQGIDVEVAKNNRITVTGANRQQVGQVAAEIRGLRPPDTYKGKGIRYADERLKLKVGKAGA